MFYHDWSGIIHKVYGSNDLAQWMIGSNIKKYYKYDIYHKEFKEIYNLDNVDEHVDAVILTSSAYNTQPISTKVKEWITESNGFDWVKK